MKSDDWTSEHESYELKWAGERDADDYEKQMAQERRESLAFRNAEGRRIRDVEQTMKADDWTSEHESYELKWAGERDADDYKKQMAAERRDSLAFRNAKSLTNRWGAGRFGHPDEGVSTLLLCRGGNIFWTVDNGGEQ